MSLYSFIQGNTIKWIQNSSQRIGQSVKNNSKFSFLAYPDEMEIFKLITIFKNSQAMEFIKTIISPN